MRDFDRPIPAETVRDPLADAVAAFEDGDRPHVAVVGDPFSGRATVTDQAASLLGDTAERVRFTTPVESEDALGLPDADAVVVDGCQYLYTRRIDGFGAVERLADRLAAGERFFVTTWTTHAWNYLSRVRNVDDLFAVAVSLPPLDAGELEALLTAETEVEPTFAVGDVEDGPDAEYDVSLPGGTVSITLPDLGNLRGSDDPSNVRERVFEAIARLSKGNPGVARAMWYQSLVDGEITLARVRSSVPTVDLPDEEAFALQVLLTKERLDRGVLRQVVGSRLYDRSLRQLLNQDVVTTESGTVALRPQAVPSAVAFLERRRLLW